MPIQRSYLTLYLSNGETLRYENVSNVRHEEWNDRLYFDYVSASTDIRSTAMFQVAPLLGYTYTKEV